MRRKDLRSLGKHYEALRVAAAIFKSDLATEILLHLRSSKGSYLTKIHYEVKSSTDSIYRCINKLEFLGLVDRELDRKTMRKMITINEDRVVELGRLFNGIENGCNKRKKLVLF
jgi:DNA-binding PadR family transcriptional regulator